jgi:hypothetical protein
MHAFRLIAALFAAAQIFVLSSTAQALSLQEKATLQAAMQHHVERQSINGVFHLMDTKTGDVVPLHPVKAHPKIMRMGENFVLCFDFLNAEGKKVDIDFYMARKGNTYVVFHTAMSDHSLLGRLMGAGKITRAD